MPPARLYKVLDRLWKIETDSDWATLFAVLRIEER
jgi:hypothetical protein